MSGDEICQRCGTKFEVDGYCENGHARPAPAAQPEEPDPYVEYCKDEDQP
jgi:hypothetical protein